jgi:cytochrome c
MQGMNVLKGQKSPWVGEEEFDDFEWDLPEGSVERGRKLSKKHCWQCHSVYEDNRASSGQIGHGPTLFNAVYRTSGVTRGNGPGGGTSLVEGEIMWTPTALMNYMQNPRRAMGAVQMNFAGISDVQKRVDIIHYMMTLDYRDSKLWNAPLKEGGLGPLIPRPIYNVLRYGQYSGITEEEKKASAAC